VKVTDLTAQLQQEAAETSETVKQMQIEALEALKNALAQQCSDAESTLKSALEETLESMKIAVSESASAMNEQLATVKSDVKKWTPKFFWAVKVGVVLPVLATLIVCLGMIGGSLVWWKIQDREHVHMKPFFTDKGEKLMMVDEPTWFNCQEQTVTDKVTGKKTVYWQRCRKAD